MENSVARNAPPTNRSNSSLLRRRTESVDRTGIIIDQVGTGSSSVPIDLLQSLYLSKSTSGRSSPALSARRREESFYSQTSFDEAQEEIRAWPESVVYTRTTQFPNVKKLAAKDKKRILITGGAGKSFSHSSHCSLSISAGPNDGGRRYESWLHFLKSLLTGFVGGHLVDRLMASGHDVTVLDNLSSGSKSSISHWMYVPSLISHP